MMIYFKITEEGVFTRGSSYDYSAVYNDEEGLATAPQKSTHNYLMDNF